MSISAYRKTVKAHEDPRQIERRILADVTAALARHADTFDAAETASDRFATLAGGLRDALWRNQKLWEVFATSAANPQNELPVEVRADLISLAGFVREQTGRALGGTAKIAPLLDINRTIADAVAGGQSSPATDRMAHHAGA